MTIARPAGRLAARPLPNPPPACSYSGKSHGVGACVIETLNAVAQALASAPQGRKTIVYISDGIPYDFTMTDFRGWRQSRARRSTNCRPCCARCRGEYQHLRTRSLRRQGWHLRT